ncbi:class I SAM-dependent methyltransferase [Streptomyces sp. NBC_01340]|uniref:class I SAM-dependent methyltransferase n=1 Tax=unclassified Streptomyces TaxID=2593676 RepID=UPI0022532201|nr:MULTISPECIES: class I SAM-dependent methyltransferase [unclassified Streptomyces]MCX4458041.1 class I SAM-dependent methyltransferase [Streptomyces sp. NBC_01719]MCX4497398.1 class I SAM-dependent methyltransferase [Streptomyces sp. NBC_01728]MCX4596555.1 class I SAM-dependent methyltransferase [Streptomyces sp. NBC_01549]WSI42245.1 class I SAM-dependent methyltransferase [Streptomyces sp. NBC_01340]
MTQIANFDQARAWNGAVGNHWASHRERYDTLVSGLNAALFDAAAITAGERVLDVGCGAGATTRIAGRLAAHGHAVGVDISAPLLDLARATTTVEGVTNVAYEFADAQTHPFPPAGYDVLISRGGVMFFADHVAAFRNLARSLRPGGRLAFVCPQPAGPEGEESRALSLFGQLLDEPDAATVAVQAAMASLSDPARIREVLHGWDDVTVAAVAAETTWGRDAADAVGFVLSRTPGRTADAATRAALEDTLRPYETDRGVRLRAAVWLVTAKWGGGPHR